LLRQYERAFRAYGIAISFEDEALRLMAQAGAREENRRARLVDGMGETLSRFQILSRRLRYQPTAGDGRISTRTETRFGSPVGGRSQTEVVALDQQIDVFTESFRRQHDLEIAFEDAARRRLVERAQTEKMSMAD